MYLVRRTIGCIPGERKCRDIFFYGCELNEKENNIKNILNYR